MTWLVPGLVSLLEARGITMRSVNLLHFLVQVRVHVLTEQSDLLEPVSFKQSCLVQDRVHWPRTFHSSSKRHDAETAHVRTPSRT